MRVAGYATFVDVDIESCYTSATNGLKMNVPKQEKMKGELHVERKITMTFLLAICACLCIGSITVLSEQKAVSVSDVSIVVKGYEWGPGVPKTVLQLSEAVTAVSEADFTVITADVEREVIAIYLCDVHGEKVEGSSDCVAIELVTCNTASGSPFCYNTQTRMNEWAKSYEVQIKGRFTANGQTVLADLRQDCIEKRICIDTALFNKRIDFTGVYKNNCTGTDEELTLHLAAYEPEKLAGGAKNPLIIWLHGSGEGGKDADITILGNEVSALAKAPIQSYFTSGNETGAYVLTLTCERYWMDEGDGSIGPGNGTPLYGDILIDAISFYVASNPDVDTKRLYVGGCSNGAFIATYSILNNPTRFAAGFLVCGTYPYYEATRNDAVFVTEAQLKALGETPLWFIVSMDDTAVNPKQFTLPLYRSILKMGATNCWLSAFQHVKGTDTENAAYHGHHSWIYLFNNQVTGVQNPVKVAASRDIKTFGVTATNDGGGTETANGFSNIFEWMNAQSR